MTVGRLRRNKRSHSLRTTWISLRKYVIANNRRKGSLLPTEFTTECVGISNRSTSNL